VCIVLLVCKNVYATPVAYNMHNYVKFADGGGQGTEKRMGYGPARIPLTCGCCCNRPRAHARYRSCNMSRRGRLLGCRVTPLRLDFAWSHGSHDGRMFAFMLFGPARAQSHVWPNVSLGSCVWLGSGGGNQLRCLHLPMGLPMGQWVCQCHLK
jgi:hypothetical protein